jgi:hypothetical protein
VLESFDRVFDQLMSEFPHSADPDLRALASHRITPPGNLAVPSKSGAGGPECRRALEQKIAACMDTEFARADRNPMDFSHIAKCKQRFSAEYDACGN